MLKYFNKGIIFAAFFTLIIVSPITKAGLLYYNDGAANNFNETFGDVGFNVSWNTSFESGGFMDGTSDDVPPFNTITNEGLVTLQGAAGGVSGGGFRLQVNPAAGAGGRKGAILLPYGTQAQSKNRAKPAWLSKFKKLGQDLGVNPQQAIQIWRDQGAFVDGRTTKLVKYIGDPLVSIPPTDLAQSDLTPLDTVTVTAALQDDNVLAFFWEVTGTREMSILDLLFGDFELNTGYEDVLHHFPYLAVLDDVSPADFGIDPLSANIIQFNGDSLPGSTPFVGSMAIVVSDPVPEPSTLSFFAIAGLLASRRFRKQLKSLMNKDG